MSSWRGESELVHQNEQLRAMAAELATLTRLKNEFIANMSHELRTPLNAIIGFAQLLFDAKIGPVTLTIEAEERLGEVVTDPARLKQVLLNYVSNALKFTPEGGRITIRLAAEEGDSFRLEVEDTGIGIRAEDAERIFVKFEQLDSGSAKHYPGTGLGLALTRRIVEALGGSVGFTSALGLGSTFFAVFPSLGERAA
jgi:signal transduction histidine kinase